MEFTVDKHSPLPIHIQLQEQIKLALLLGRLRPGDTLPSIRDVEKHIGVNRNIVRKAYVALCSSGILKLWHGKGVLVDKDLRYPENSHISRKCEAFSGEILASIRQMGVSPTAFSRYLYQHAREDEARQPFIVYVDATHELAVPRAAQISAIWQTVVPGISTAELKQMQPLKSKNLSKVLTNYLRYDEVVRTVNNKAIDVIPLGVTFEHATVREWSAIPSGATVLYVMDDNDYPSLSLILELYRKILIEPSVKITSVPVSQIPDLEKFIRTTKSNKIIFSNRIWERLPASLKRHSKVTHAEMKIDLGSLENARIRAGIIV